MAYNNTYTSADMSSVTIDLLATVIVAVVGFASLVGLVLLYKWFTGKKKI